MFTRYLLAIVLILPATLAQAAEAEAEADSSAAHSSEDESHGDGHGGGHGGGGHGGGGGSVDPLSTDPDLAIWTLVVFLAMLAILSQVAWKPIMEALKAREENIAGDLAAADQKHEEAKALLAQHQAELAGAADQVRELLEEARRDADATIAQAKADAKSEFEAERLRAERDIEQARSAAVRSLAEQTAGLAIDLAGKVVQQDISADRQKEIVHEALGRFAGSDPSAN